MSDYPYSDVVREDILRMVPADGLVIGSIGCGTGATEALLVKNRRTVHGVDVSPEAIRVARERLSSARVIDKDDRTPFAPNSLDGLILADVLEHIPAAWDALRSFAQAVRIGGWIVISVPNMLYLEGLHEMLWRRDWPEKSVGIFDATHVQFMTMRRIKRWCLNSGLTIERSFDRYDPNGPRRYRASRLLDILTCRILHEFCTYQIQLRCRRTS